MPLGEQPALQVVELRLRQLQRRQVGRRVRQGHVAGPERVFEPLAALRQQVAGLGQEHQVALPLDQIDGQQTCLTSQLPLAPEDIGVDLLHGLLRRFLPGAVGEQGAEIEAQRGVPGSGGPESGHQRQDGQAELWVGQHARLDQLGLGDAVEGAGGAKVGVVLYGERGDLRHRQRACRQRLGVGQPIDRGRKLRRGGEQ